MALKRLCSLPCQMEGEVSGGKSGEMVSQLQGFVFGYRSNCATLGKKMKTLNGTVKSALLRTITKECINRRQKDCKASFSSGLVIHQCGADIAQAPFPDWEILMSHLGWESHWKFPLQSCKSAQATTARVCCFTVCLGLNWWSRFVFFFYLWGKKV